MPIISALTLLIHFNFAVSVASHPPALPLHRVSENDNETFIAEIDSNRAITRPEAVTAETVTPHSSPKKRRIIYRTDPLSPSKGKGKGKA
jgi:hypothetical protein